MSSIWFPTVNKTKSAWNVTRWECFVLWVTQIEFVAPSRSNSSRKTKSGESLASRCMWRDRRQVWAMLLIMWSYATTQNSSDFRLRIANFNFSTVRKQKFFFFRLIKFSITNILAPATLAVCFFHYFRLNRCVRARGFESFRFVRLRCRWTEFGSRDNFLYFIFFRVSWKKKNAHNEAKCKAQSGANTGEA